MARIRADELVLRTRNEISPFRGSSLAGANSSRAGGDRATDRVRNHRSRTHLATSAPASRSACRGAGAVPTVEVGLARTRAEALAPWRWRQGPSTSGEYPRPHLTRRRAY